MTVAALNTSRFRKLDETESALKFFLKRGAFPSRDGHGADYSSDWSGFFAASKGGVCRVCAGTNDVNPQSAARTASRMMDFKPPFEK